MKKNVLLLLLLFVGIVFGSYFAFNAVLSPNGDNKVIKDAVKPVVEEKPEPTYSQLTGEAIPEDRAKLRPLAVMVENSPAARPQTGLTEADMVYEIVAEAGITRFQAIFQSKDAPTVGPVRSIRDYFASLAKSVDGILVHCGGSKGGYDAVKQLNVAEIDQFKNSKPFWRSKSRRAPHNLYGSTLKLRERAKELGFEMPVDLGDRSFKDDDPAGKRGATNLVRVNFSSAQFKVGYSYNKSTNTYLRYMNGAAHKDAVSGKQLQPKNVVVIITQISATNDYKGHMTAATDGSGTAFVFRDGKFVKGQWQRSTSSMFDITDESGKPIELNRGQSWYEIIGSENQLSYPQPVKKPVKS